jgi:hypothetical protein
VPCAARRSSGGIGRMRQPHLLASLFTRAVESSQCRQCVPASRFRTAHLLSLLISPCSPEIGLGIEPLKRSPGRRRSSLDSRQQARSTQKRGSETCHAEVPSAAPRACLHGRGRGRA